MYMLLSPCISGRYRKKVNFLIGVWAKVWVSELRYSPHSKDAPLARFGHIWTFFNAVFGSSSTVGMYLDRIRRQNPPANALFNWQQKKKKCPIRN